jgi:hypothetical protein
MLVLILILFLLPLLARELGVAFNPVAMVLLPVVGWLVELVGILTGWRLS